jgi:RNA polymerase sigma-54 factor
VASESVKERIRQLVREEDPSKPYSDQELVSILKSENIDIARRTVAKYREMLGILPSNKRRRSNWGG